MYVVAALYHLSLTLLHIRSGAGWIRELIFEFRFGRGVFRLGRVLAGSAGNEGINLVLEAQTNGEKCHEGDCNPKRCVIVRLWYLRGWSGSRSRSQQRGAAVRRRAPPRYDATVGRASCEAAVPAGLLRLLRTGCPAAQ
jgi:hypothetical protein